MLGPHEAFPLLLADIDPSGNLVKILTTIIPTVLFVSFIHFPNGKTSSSNYGCKIVVSNYELECQHCSRTNGKNTPQNDRTNPVRKISIDSDDCGLQGRCLHNLVDARQPWSDPRFWRWSCPLSENGDTLAGPGGWTGLPGIISSITHSSLGIFERTRMILECSLPLWNVLLSQSYTAWFILKLLIFL